ncbi:MAG: hypothetical protein WC897_04100 [Candidatus Gracilibacteria bacterium]
MDKKKLIKHVVLIPKEFYELKNVSPCELIKKSGYLEYHGLIGMEDIESFLKEHLGLVSYWLKYSDDQRGVPALLFYESKSKKGEYEVGRYTDERGHELIQKFSNLNKACAFYILKEIEALRSICG